MRLVVFLLLLGLGLAFGQTGGAAGASDAIGTALEDATSGLLPKFLTFIGVLASIGISWAVVKMIRG